MTNSHSMGSKDKRRRKAILIQWYGESCFYCHRTICRLTLDHLVPFSKGGGNRLENLVLSCHSCNRDKKDDIYKGPAPPHAKERIDK